MNSNSLYRLNHPDRLLSPSLLLFRPLVLRNLETMVRLAGSPDRLRPHMKTHKMPELIRLCEAMGIRKHKCATIAEAEMAARAGASDVLISYPLVGPNLERLASLIRTFPNTQFRAIVDDPSATQALNDAMARAGLASPLPTLVDLEVGMGRTGIAPGPGAVELYGLLANSSHLSADGLHAYDGHVRDRDPADRRRTVEEQVHGPVLRLRDELKRRGWPVPRLVFGGTPAFPIHADSAPEGSECSPGTCALHDFGYQSMFPDLPFVPAAILLTRVVSRPRAGRVTLDLGHKAVAADPQGDRLKLLDLPDAKLGGQSEEHLVVETAEADRLSPGTILLAIPTHICPTCALHRRAYVIDDGELVGEWEIGARDRVLTI